MWLAIHGFLADTLGVVYRAATGKQDPWSAHEAIERQRLGR